MTVAVCEPSVDARPETFIQAHIDRLPGTVLHLSGDWPIWECRGRRIVPLIYRAALQFRCKLPGGVQPLVAAAAQRRMTRFLKTHGVQVVLAEYGATAVALLDTCAAARLPLVAHFHGADAYHRDTLKQYKDGYQNIFRRAAAIVAVSSDMREHLIGLGAPRDRLFCNPCGVDTTMFSGTDAGANPPHLVAVGRFVDKKAPHLTILAFQRVAATCPEARLTMVGEGYLLDACRQMAEALGLADRICFAGKQDHAAVARLMQGARGFVQHSVTATHGDSEGTPVAILEAGAMALPVVSTRHAGIKDVVVSGETGWLVEERDIDSMAHYMTCLLQTPQLATAMGARARSRICNHFSMDRSIHALADILRHAASQGPDLRTSDYTP